jgi:hypothetical protein
MRFARDRGQEFMDLGAAATPNIFHQLRDVEIAMGWTTIDQALTMKGQPDSLDQVLARVAHHREELDEAFSEERERFTRARVERARHERGQAFLRRYQS